MNDDRETGGKAQAESHPPTVLGWIARVASLALLAALFAVLVQEALRPERPIRFTVEPKLADARREGDVVLVPIEVTNRGSRTAYAVELVVGSGGEEHALEIDRISQNESVTHVIGWASRPGRVTARIVRYREP